MWAPILEKAWAKVKGSYEGSGWGYYASGIRSLTGAPNFMYTDITDTNEYFDLINGADDAGYLMAIDTEGDGSNSNDSNNICGLMMQHTFSLIASFIMTD